MSHADIDELDLLFAFLHLILSHPITHCYFYRRRCRLSLSLSHFGVFFSVFQRNSQNEYTFTLQQTTVLLKSLRLPIE